MPPHAACFDGKQILPHRQVSGAATAAHNYRRFGVNGLTGVTGLTGAAVGTRTGATVGNSVGDRVGNRRP